MAALRASVEARKGGGGGSKKSRGNGGSAADDLEKLSKDELYARAKELDVKGRADMSKDELVEAVRAAA